MSDVRVEWDDQAVLEAIKSNQSIQGQLMELAQAKAAECSASAAVIMHSPMTSDAFEADARTLPRTGLPAATIHASTNAGAAINRKHGVLHW